MAELKYPASFNQKVDVGKVKTDVISKFVAHRPRYRVNPANVHKLN